MFHAHASNIMWIISHFRALYTLRNEHYMIQAASTCAFRSLFGIKTGMVQFKTLAKACRALTELDESFPTATSWHESERRQIVEHEPNALITTKNEHIKDDSISGTSGTSSISVQRPGSWSIPWQRPGFLRSFFYQSHEITEHLYAPDELFKTQVHKLRLQLPRWLMQRAWDLHALRAYSGWTIQLRAWTTRPEDAEIFKLISNGQTDLVVKAIRNKEASLYDRDMFGYSLIEYAMLVKQLNVIKALMSLGLSLADTGQNILPLLILLWSWQRPDATLAESAHILATEETEAFGYHVYTPRLIWNFEGLWELLGSHIHFQDLLNGFSWDLTNPLVPLGMLSQGAVEPKYFRKGPMPFRSSLQAFATQYFHTFLNCQTSMESWRMLARKMFVGATTTETSLINITKILTTFRRRQFVLRPFEIWVTRAVKMLLEDLVLAGIDLEEYMKCEAIRSRECSYKDRSIEESLQLRPGMRIQEFGPALVILESGSMPSDWAFTWDPCVEELSGEFWSMVSYTERPIPGAWVDFDPYSEALEDCHMKQLFCELTRPISVKNKLKENKLLRVRGMTTCQEMFPV